MSEVSSLKPLANESKGFAFWVELVAPGLPSVGYLSYVICELLHKSGGFTLLSPKGLRLRVSLVIKKKVYESDDMVVDKNDEQSAQGNKVICFVYFTMYGMMLVALTPNYRIAPVSWALLVLCCNEDPIDLFTSDINYSYFLYKAVNHLSPDCYHTIPFSYLESGDKYTITSDCFDLLELRIIQKQTLYLGESGNKSSPSGKLIYHGLLGIWSVKEGHTFVKDNLYAIAGVLGANEQVPVSLKCSLPLGFASIVVLFELSWCKADELSIMKCSI
ncbi:hypothetical protein H5410_001424 [Solanum commersonii]|uniref:Uncharacterized protein n=1 Tax=Solanum commersonii TaxID=4109 RepID=A0A9J6AZM6_SOLCO|nr:hypothetical protein H5410_001424 [Solanum commersonii]